MMQGEKQLLKIYSTPQLKEPFLVAAGPGTANVGLRTAGYLREKLGAELFAEIEPGDFFTPPYSFTFRDGLIDIAAIEPGEHKPQNRFYYWKSGKAHDIIFFTGNAHPLPGKVPELAGYVLEVAKGFGLYRLYMPGAFLTDIHHLSEPTIYGSATNDELRQYLHSCHITDAPPMNIAHNLNAWLLGMARSKSIDAIGLVSEMPAYKPEDSNIRACRTLAKLLLRMLDIGTLDIADLDTMLAEEDKLMEQRLAELRESTDQRVINFLRYLDMLEKRDREMSRGRGIILPSSEIELPASLKFIEELYAQAISDSRRVQELRLAVQQLESADRLLILRKYGDEIMSLLGYQV
jgi:proteasome assembly chaperone (PAC2) family protein